MAVGKTAPSNHDPSTAVWIGIGSSPLAAAGGVWRAPCDAMDVQMLDDGYLPEQDHLHAVGTAILTIREGQRLRDSMQTCVLDRA